MSDAVFGPYAGVVDLVHDGDTINVKLDVGFDLTVYARVRVFGINAPELSTDAGKAARDFAKTLLAPATPCASRATAGTSTAAASTARSSSAPTATRWTSRRR
jgi:endonuclease YncB( thermonuclease family)